MAVDAGTIRSEVRVALDRLRADLKAVDARFDKFAKNQKNTQKKVETGWKKAFGGIGIAGIAAFAAIGLAVKSAVKLFADFEQSLANVESVAGATAAEMKELEEAAISAGEQTRFTASQAAEAMYFLASAGFSATQSIEALDGVLALATATQSDLAFTSAAVASSISQFGLEAADAAKVSNVFAAAIGNSQATMDKMAISMRNVGTVANVLNHSIEGTTGSLQALFDAGFIASQAGTGLRNILASLASQADPTVQKLALLGVKFDDINTATHSLAEIVGTLNEANLEGGEILAAFGVKAGPAMLALLETGEDALNDYTAAVTGTNAATEAAAIQLDTLQGSYDQLKSVMQSASLQMIGQVAPALRGIVDFLRLVVGGFNELPGPIKAFVGAALAAIPVIGGLTLAITLLKAASGLGLVAILSTAAGAIVGLTLAIVNGRKEQRAYRDMLYDTRDALQALTREEQESRRAQFVVQALDLGRRIHASQAVIDAIREERDAMIASAAETGTASRRLAHLNVQWDLHNGILAEATGEYDDLSAAIAVIDEELLDQDELLRSNTQGTDELIDSTEDLAAALIAEGAALQKISDLITEYREKLEEVGATDEELLRLERERALAAVEGFEATEAQILRARAAINAYFDAVETQRDVDARAEALAEIAELDENYQKKLEVLGATERELIEIERARALALAEGYGLISDETDRANAAINEYHDQLLQLIDAEEFRANAAAVSAAKLAAAAEALATAEALAEGLAEKRAAQAEARDAAKAAILEESEARAERQAEKRAQSAEARAAARTEATEAAGAVQAKYQERLEEIGLTELELIELERARALSALLGFGATADEIDRATESINAYFDAASSEAAEEARKRLLDDMVDLSEVETGYIQKLEDRNASEVALIELQRQRAIAAIRASGAEEAAIDSAIAKLNEYFDALQETDPWETFQDIAKTSFDFVSQLISNLSELFTATTDRAIADMDRQLVEDLAAIDTRLQAELAAAGLAEETRIESLQAQLQEAIADGDAETAARLTDEIERLEIKSRFADEATELEARHEKEKAQAEYDAALRSWRMQVLMTIAQSAQAALNAYSSTAAIPLIGAALAPFAALAAAAFGIIQLATVRRSKPEPPAFQTGGMVISGGSSAGTTVRVAENDSNELLFNDSSAGRPFLREFAAEIADVLRQSEGKSLIIQLDVDGLRMAEAVAERVNNGQVRLQL